MDRACKLKIVDGKHIWEKPTGFTAEEKRFFKRLLKEYSTDADNIEKFISGLNKCCLARGYLLHIERPNFACITKHTKAALKSIKNAISHLELMHFESLKGTKQLLEIDGEIKTVSLADDIDILMPFKLQIMEVLYTGLYDLEKILEQQLSESKQRKSGRPSEGYLLPKSKFIEPIAVLFEEHIGKTSTYPKGVFALVVNKVFELFDLQYEDTSNPIRTALTALKNHKS